MGKRQYLVEELGPGTVELMKTIKKAVDPMNLFNPGKVRFGSSLFIVALLMFALSSSYIQTQIVPKTSRNRNRCLFINHGHNGRTFTIPDLQCSMKLLMTAGTSFHRGVRSDLSIFVVEPD
jgi:hypothetical protein